ncbi:MAG: Clp protease ClpP [Planctomycetes bacterium]|nr:Clp protease ClpP [Planctomycetota bacterium]
MTTTLKDGKGYALDTSAEGSPTPTLHLYDVIGEDLIGGIAAHRVVEDLGALGTIDALDVRVNSPGGDVFEGIALYNALSRFPAKVTVHIDGIAASIASLIALAGDRTVIAENAMVMVHRPWTAVLGDAEQLRHHADALDKAWSAMLATYSRRTGRRAETFAQRVVKAGGEWWLTAEEAVAEGFADAVVRPEKQAQVFGLSRFHRVPERLAARATDNAVPPAAHPAVLEIAAPRVVRDAPSGSAAAAARRRVVEVLRLGG